MSEYDEQEAGICDSCRGAVVRAYRELRELGQDDLSAFRAAMHILELRHPERPARLYPDLVSRWLETAGTV